MSALFREHYFHGQSQICEKIMCHKHMVLHAYFDIPFPCSIKPHVKVIPRPLAYSHRLKPLHGSKAVTTGRVRKEGKESHQERSVTKGSHQADMAGTQRPRFPDVPTLPALVCRIYRFPPISSTPIWSKVERRDRSTSVYCCSTIRPFQCSAQSLNSKIHCRK